MWKKKIKKQPTHLFVNNKGSVLLQVLHIFIVVVFCVSTVVKGIEMKAIQKNYDELHKRQLFILKFMKEKFRNYEEQDEQIEDNGTIYLITIDHLQATVSFECSKKLYVMILDYDHYSETIENYSILTQ